MLSPCSPPSRPSPGGRAKCAALTATALVGDYDVRAGMEGWAPQGPNKRMRSEERMGGAAGNVSTGRGVFAPWREPLLYNHGVLIAGQGEKSHAVGLCRLLGAQRHRPHRRASKPRYKLPPSHQ